MTKEMTYAQALRLTLDTLKVTDFAAMGLTTEQIERLDTAQTKIEALYEKYTASHKDSDKVKENRKAKNAAARADAIKDVLPIIRDTIKAQPDMTAKEIYAACAEQLPSDWNAAKVQYLLLHELAGELVKVEVKGKANVYHIA